jgi:dimethylaniline monooxygenase (N-oxide forming)
MPALPRVCLVGAGSSGIAVAKAFQDSHIPFDCYEKSDRVGGNWVFKNKNGLSSAYRSLHINTSRTRMQYADYPMPEGYPDFPHHELIARYFDAYVDHFGLRDKIKFETGVEKIERRETGGYEVELDDGRTLRYDAVAIANGHHWQPQWPDPPFPGEFSGIQLHSHHYIDPGEPEDLVGKRVVVVGMGNSAMDIASELCRPGVAQKVWVAARRGAWVIPKYLLGKPLDKAIPLPVKLPLRVRGFIARRIYSLAVGRMEDYGLPTPDHELGQAHPTISSDFLVRVGSGDIAMKPNLSELRGTEVAFVDGSVEQVDAIIYSTGYKVAFPFFDQSFVFAPGNDLPLFRRVYKPDVPDLFFFGLLQPLGAIMPLAEAQGKWVAEYLTGGYALPPPRAMERDMEEERKAMFERYVPSRRHTMQVDYDDYMVKLEKELVAGRKRARRSGNPLPILAR